jgi:hypothetical protein
MSADLDNIICLCAKHHLVGTWNRASTDFNWHGSPKEAIDWFKKKWPALDERLHQRSLIKQHLDIKFWENKMEELKNIEEILERGIENEVNDLIMARNATGEVGDRAIENEIDEILTSNGLFV